MIGSPAVSVVMPVYNAGAYLGIAVESVLRQSFEDFEFIVVDDGSTDDSLEIAGGFGDRRLRLVRHDVNEGYPAAMNSALAVARGHYIARMDADDYSNADRLEKQVAFLSGHSDLAFAGTLRYWITPHGKVYRKRRRGQEKWLEETWERVYEGTRSFTDPSVLVRLRLVEEAGGYRTYQRSGQDVDLWLRILETGRKGATLLEELYGRRLTPQSITFSEGTTARNRLPRLLAEQRRQCGSDAVSRGESIEELLEPEMWHQAHRWRVRALWGAASMCWCTGDYRSCCDFAFEALRAGGVTPRSLRWAAKYGFEAMKGLRSEIPGAPNGNKHA